MDRAPVGQVEDLATLSKLDEQILLDELKARYKNDLIYTYVGDILVAVNPFKELAIYGQKESSLYKMTKKSQNPPHVFSMSDSAYQAMMGYTNVSAKNQCILISGESGAGKTESTKLVIKQLINLCKGNTQLEQQILQVNPLLEAFGNAQTVMNDNSSRFGKYIQLRFNNGHIMGAKISEYLLEKSRVVRQNRGEENFHIFYYMYAGLTPELLQKYKLEYGEECRYFTNGSSSLKSSFTRLKKMYDELVNAMDLVGFSEEEQDDMFMILSSVLNMGNISFDQDDSDASFVKDKATASKVASLLGVDTDELQDCFTCKVDVTRGEEIRRNYTKQQASDARDATAKTLYGRLFGWIVNKINQLLAPQEIFTDCQEIGILDIFGFEHFDVNSFEQACINLANEQLQFFFNQHIFKMEQEEYKKEGIDWTEVPFVDNQPLLDLFMARPIGILALLDEESHFPKATDHTFVEKLNKNFEKGEYFVKSVRATSNNFTVCHYAGKVEYTADGWLEKNRDSLPAGVMEMLQRSTNTLVSLIFRGTVTRTGTLALQGRRTGKRSTKKKSMRPGKMAPKRKLTVGAQFKNSLQVLIERMTQATPHFIRCVKPNTMKAAGQFDDQFVLNQLLYTGMLQTTKIRRDGFAVRPLFSDFVKKYHILLNRKNVKESKESCVELLKSAGLAGWHVGKTKVFMKYYHIESLTDKLEQYHTSARNIQRVARGYLGRLKAKRRRLEARKEAAIVEGLLGHITKMGLDSYDKQHTVIRGDHNIPKEFFNPKKAEVVEPEFKIPEIVTTAESSSNPIQEEEGSSGSDSDEIVEDEFETVKTVQTKYGPQGTRMASVRWFKETQTLKVSQNTGGFFEWFHGIITRRESEMLLQPKPVGCFLIRVSESRFGYSLSFRVEDRCRHYMIDQTKSGKYVIVGEPKVHKDLTALVEYHQKVPISNYAGLLTKPCGQVDGQCDYFELVDESRPASYFELIYNDQEIYDVAKEPGPDYMSLRGAPAIPDRNYSMSSVPSRMAPAPPPPRSNHGNREHTAYTHLLQSQEVQNSKKRLSTARSKLPHH